VAGEPGQGGRVGEWVRPKAIIVAAAVAFSSRASKNRDRNTEKMTSPPFQPHSYPFPQPPNKAKEKHFPGFAPALGHAEAGAPPADWLRAAWPGLGATLRGLCLRIGCVSVCLGECVSVARAGDRERW
jgi:hypothetical protein